MIRLALLLGLAACVSPPDPQPASRVAGANPRCRHHCTATVMSVDGNRSDQLAPVITGNRTTTETVNE